MVARNRAQTTLSTTGWRRGGIRKQKLAGDSDLLEADATGSVVELPALVVGDFLVLIQECNLIFHEDNYAPRV